MSIKTKFLLVVVGLCFVSSSILFAANNKADEALSRGKKLYAEGRYEEAMDSFVDVFLSGNQDQIAEANEYVNLIHFERGGVVPPKQVPYDKELEDRQNIGVQGKNLYDKDAKKDKEEKQPKEDLKKYKEVPVKEKKEPDVKEPSKSVAEADPFGKPESNTKASTGKNTKTGANKGTKTGTTAKAASQQKTNSSGKKGTQTSAKNGNKTGTKTGTKTAAGVTTNKSGTKSTGTKSQKHPKATKSTGSGTQTTSATPRAATTQDAASTTPQVADTAPQGTVVAAQVAATPQDTNTPAQAETTPQGSVVTVQVADNEPQDSVVTVQVTKTTPQNADATQDENAAPQGTDTTAAPAENQEPVAAVVPAVVVGAEATPSDKGAEATAPQQDTNTAAQATTEEHKTAAETKEAEPTVNKTATAAAVTPNNSGKVKTAVTKPQAHSNLSQEEIKEMSEAEAKAKKKQEKAAAKAKRKQEKAAAKAKRKQEKAEAKARKKQAKAEAKARKQKEKELDKAKRKDIVIPEELVIDNKETTPQVSKYTLRNQQRIKENEQRQKMREELLIKLRKNKDVQIYMRDGKIDAIDIPSDILFRNRTINKDAKEIMDYVYGLMIVENPPAYYILPEGSFTDDVTVQSVRQAVSLNSYLINRGISPGKLNLNMGLSTQEPPEKFRDLAGTSIIFDYDGKTRSKATKLQEKRDLPPALSLAVAPFEEIIPTWDEAFLIDFSVMETAAPIKKWTLQIISHDIDGHFYVIKQYSGKSPIAKQVFWNGKKLYFGQPLPTGNYTAVLWAVDSENRERLLKRKLVLREAPRKFYDEDEKTEPEVIQEENKEQVKKAVKAKSVTLNYKQKRLWKKPGKKLPPAPKVEEVKEELPEQEKAQADSSAGYYDYEY